MLQEPIFDTIMKKKLKYIFWTMLFLLLVGGVWQFENLHYFAAQGYGQAKVSWNARPLEEFLEKEDFADSLKEKIHLVQEIRLFTEKELGLKPSKSYTKLYDQKGKSILWNVSACKPYAFKSKKWDFPIIGSFSYKGFFDKAKVLETRDLLKEEGWDTSIYPVSAWSTLGWLDDPLLSKNLNLSVGRLSSLIIHELTHGTLFIKDSLAYNENLANFVGDEGAKLFLIKKFGEESEEYQSYMNAKTDQYVFKKFILQSAKDLEEIYKHFEGTPLEQKQEAKKEYINKFLIDFKSIEFLNPKYSNYFENYRPNNTFFMSFIRYDGKRNDFEKEFETEFDSNFPKYFEYLKKKYGNLSL